MVTVHTQTKVLDDVLQWLVDQTFCVEEVSLNNGDVALSAGASLIGKLAWNVTGTTWKILDDGDSITAASIICPIVHTRKLLADAAADASAIVPRCAILRRGPAVVQKEELEIDAVEATVLAAMLALGIKTVTSSGSVYSV